MNDPTVNYYEVAKAGHAYYENVDLSVKGTGHKQFHRWLNANEYKYYPSGDRDKVDPYFALNQYKSFINGQRTSKVLSTNDWKDLAAISVLSAIVSTHYAFARVQNMYRF